MIQTAFAHKAADILKNDPSVIGLAVAGSWLTHELDEFSDLDLVLVTKEKISGNKNKMLAYAGKIGQLLTGFTGEHVGEPRLLICLYDNPLLHVDIKFLTLDEFQHRIEQPVILLDTEDQLKPIIETTGYEYPFPDYQWIEDRFWIWIHYALLKVGRGELMEAFDFMGYLRMSVLGPLLHISNQLSPRGVRKLETLVPEADFDAIRKTIPLYNVSSIINSLENAVDLYSKLRRKVFSDQIKLNTETEKRVLSYLAEVKTRVKDRQ